MVGAALAHAEYAEIIPDLLHVHPGAIRAARRAIPKLFCVTDSTAGAGMPDGQYHLGSHTVTKCLGGVRLADGTQDLLAGGRTLDPCARLLLEHPLEGRAHLVEVRLRRQVDEYQKIGGACRLVDDFHCCSQRNDLRIKSACRLRCGGALL